MRNERTAKAAREIKCLVKGKPEPLDLEIVIVPLIFEFIKKSDIKHREDVLCSLGCWNLDSIIQENRNLYCPYYSYCLNYICIMDYKGFVCTLCPYEFKQDISHKFFSGGEDLWEQLSDGLGSVKFLPQ